MKIEYISIIKKPHSADLILVHTNFPSPYYLAGNLILEFQTEKNQGEKYVKENFPNISYKIINDDG